MAAQLNYGYSTGKGIAGGIFDAYHYKIDSRVNEEANGVLQVGVGVVQGSIPGSNVKLPDKESSTSTFEGVVVNGFSNQQNLDGNLTIANNQNIGVMREGRIYAVVAFTATPAYGKALYLCPGTGEFTTEATDNVKISGRFLGEANNGIAPIELYGID